MSAHFYPQIMALVCGSGWFLQKETEKIILKSQTSDRGAGTGSVNKINGINSSCDGLQRL